MVDRYTSPPIELPAGGDAFVRADLLFYGVDHSGDSFEARLFFDDPDADQRTPREHPSYAGSFYVFGHGGCFGDLGHCDVPAQDDPFDLRPPHPLLPATRIVTVTGRVADLVRARAATVTVTVVAHTLERRSNQVLAFDTIRLAVYA